VYDQPVLSLDIFATAAALAQAPLNPDRPLDGVNLLPFLTGEKTGAPHETIFLRMYDKGAFAVRAGSNKLVISQKGAAPSLFKLAQDIGEANNLAGQAECRSVLDQLEKRRAEWNAQLMPPVFQGLQMAPKSTAKAPAQTGPMD
jgi:arylsulfatase A-like enzyme